MNKNTQLDTLKDIKRHIIAINKINFARGNFLARAKTIKTVETVNGSGYGRSVKLTFV